MDSKRFKIQITAFILIGLTTWACTTTQVPITGRKQVSKVIGGQTNEEAIEMSADIYSQLMDSLPLSNDTKKVSMVKNVGKKIQNAVEIYFDSIGNSQYLDGLNWQFNLIDNDTLVNAWAMPGGKVAFYTGILPICQDEQGLAVVMGHEIAHAVVRHGQERMNNAMLQNYGATVVAVAMRNGSAATRDIAMRAYGAGTTLLGMLPYSRTHESEADELGLYFMAMAGYDPTVAPSFWERMSGGSSGQRPPEFLSTHPSHETRIKRLNDAMPKALEYYKGN